MRKVVICTNFLSPSVGGAEKVSEKIAEYLSDNQCDVHVFTRRLPNRNHKLFTKYKVHDYIPGDVQAFENALKAVKPDVVLVYSDVFDYFRSLITLKHPFKLIIALCGANWLLQNKNFLSNLYRNLDNVRALICHSKVGNDYRICSSERFKKKTVVIPNGVDLQEFDSNKLTRNNLLPDHLNKIWILNVSNFFPGKGQEHMFKILPTLSNPERFIYLQVANDISYPIGQQLENKWKLHSKELEKTGMQVKLLKNLPRDKVIGYFKNSNMFMFTSEHEVAPLCILESMAASLAWIAPNVGNIEELKGGECLPVPKNMHGSTVFNSYVIDRFRQSIEKLLTLPTMGESGRHHIEEQYSWDKVLPSYLELVEN